MALGRFTESFTATGEGTARRYRGNVSFSITIGTGTIALKVSTNGAAGDYDTMEEWTASTEQEQEFTPVSEGAFYRFDCTADTSGTHTVTIHGENTSAGA